MTITLWGLLPKSAVDNETIEEAIDRLITAHNNDETAHLATGQSLESHKASDVIDHLAGSVLTDKTTMSEFDYLTKFEGSHGWLLVGDYDFSGWPGVRLGVSYPSSVLSYFLSQEGFPTSFFNLSKRMLIEYSGNFAVEVNARGFVGLGNQNSATIQGIINNAPDFTGFTGFGIFSYAGVVQAVVGKGSTVIVSDTQNVDLEISHLYRLYYNPLTKIATFYIDGVAVDTLDLSSMSGVQGMYFWGMQTAIAGTENNLFIFHFRAMRQI